MELTLSHVQTVVQQWEPGSLTCAAHCHLLSERCLNAHAAGHWHLPLQCKLMHRACAGATQWDEPKGGQALTGPFVPSPTFTGAAAGYVFKMGPKGLGYYQDTATGTACAVRVEDARRIALFCACKTYQQWHTFTDCAFPLRVVAMRHARYQESAAICGRCGGAVCGSGGLGDCAGCAAAERLDRAPGPGAHGCAGAASPAQGRGHRSHGPCKHMPPDSAFAPPHMLFMTVSLTISYLCSEIRGRNNVERVCSARLMCITTWDKWSLS